MLHLARPCMALSLFPAKRGAAPPESPERCSVLQPGLFTPSPCINLSQLNKHGGAMIASSRPDIAAASKGSEAKRKKNEMCQLW